MIGFNLQGGLGNMMFIIAAAEYIKKTHHIDICFYNVRQQFEHLKKSFAWTYHADEYLTIFKNVDLFQNINTKITYFNTINIPYEFTTFEIYNNYIYDGYFQSAKYFGNDFNFVRELFKPTDKVLNNLVSFDKENNYCSIHVRRGNYLDLQDSHTVQNTEYYNNAIKLLNGDVSKFVVFSDDILWCKENFIGDKFIFIENIDYICMYMMSLCKHNIIANSSFSWWGAALNNNKDKTVIAPKVWFPEKTGINYSDVVPDKWFKL